MNPGAALRHRATIPHALGFTLLEVLVALVIVALGMSALLAALSASASNIAAMRDKTVAEWIAMNKIANARLGLAPLVIGTSSGDMLNCGNSNWHWQQQVAPVDQVPGLLSITVSVQRTGAASAQSASSGPAGSLNGPGSGGSLGAPGSLNGTGCITSSDPGASLGANNPLGFNGSLGATGSLGAPGSLNAPGSLGATGSLGPSGSPGAVGPAGGASRTAGSVPALSSAAQNSSGDQSRSWLATLTGFRGNSLGAASGESPDWAGSNFAGNAGANGIRNGASGGSVIGPEMPPSSSSSPLAPQSGGAIQP